MSDQEQQIQELEITIADARKAVELGNALNRLSDNKDFKLIIGDGYLKEFALGQMELLAHPNMQDEEAQAGIIKDLQATSSLHAHFVSIMQRAATMQTALTEQEQTLEEIHNEEGEA